MRERVAHHEQQLWQESTPVAKEAVISQEVIRYGGTSPQERLEEHLIIDNPQFEKVVEHLSAIPHREKVRELYRIVQEKGILNGIKLAEAQHNPHIEDDFHRVVVEYIKTGGLVPGLEKERDLARVMKMTLYEITLPHGGKSEDDKGETFSESIGQMERFLVGMFPPLAEQGARWGHMTLEIVQSNFSTDIVFHIAVLDEHRDLFIKQLFSSFPMAKVEEVPQDYNIFNEYGVAVGSCAANVNNFVYPITNFEESPVDPIEVLLNAFTQIKREGEGAAVQFVVYPESERLIGKLKYAVGQIKQGIPVKRATNIPLSMGGVAFKALSEFVKTQIASKEKTEKDPDQNRRLEYADMAVELIEEKIKYHLARANIRIVVSAATRERAEEILTSLEAAFRQFNRAQANGLEFKRATKGRLDELLRHFTFRMKNEDETLVLNTYELSSMYHLPSTVSSKAAPQLKTVRVANAPAPADLPNEGTLLGVNKYRGEKRDIRLTKADRLRHLYVIGQTGAGKSVFLQNLIVQDIKAGNGVCFIDPHGSDVQDVLAAIPKERIEDVIYFDPSYTARPFGLNMLEYDPEKPEQKIFVANEMLSIFRKLYEAIPESMGPAFEQYFRGSVMLVMEDPESGNTLLEIPRVMVDVNFRNLKLSRCKNPLVVQFWRDIATKTSGETGLANMVPYITNKFDVFLQNDIMRPIIAQEKSSFNFRDIMDNKKILLVNLSKGRLGDINANLIGLVLVGKILMAALSRVDSYGKQLPDFYLYIDEFHNISTNSISSILSEARKYGLSLTVAHQFIAQLDEDIKKAVFGNVGNMAVFRVGAEDAEFLESQFAPTFTAADLMKIENRNAYLKMLIHGKPVTPFNVEMFPPPSGHPEIVEQLKQLSYLKYGRDRETVDSAILQKYLTAAQKPSSSPAQISSGNFGGQAQDSRSFVGQAAPSSSPAQILSPQIPTPPTPTQAPQVPLNPPPPAPATAPSPVMSPPSMQLPPFAPLSPEDATSQALKKMTAQQVVPAQAQDLKPDPYREPTG